MIPIIIVAAVFASSYGVPMDVCQNYQYLYDQCLPPTNWMCDKPKDFKSLDLVGIKQRLGESDKKYINYLQSCAECIGNPSPYGETVTYRKQPVCREVKVPVEYVNKTVYNEITGRILGQEVCQVVLNPNVQKVYKTECYNGDSRKKDQYCRFDYGVFKEYFCRPTNFVYRTMLVYCPSNGIQYYKEKVSTACSCVKVKCVTGI